MDDARIQHGQSERIYATAQTSTGLITGSIDVLLEIERDSDGYYFDFASSSFTNAGWVTRQNPMTELNAIESPGVYYFDFNPTPTTNFASETDFHIRVTSSSSEGMPKEAYLRVGGWVDTINHFSASAGGRSAGGTGLTNKQMEDIGKMVWKTILKGDLSAKDVLLSKSEFDASREFVRIAPDEKKELLLNSMKNKLESIDLDDNVAKLEGLVNKLKPYDYTGILKTIDDKAKSLTDKIDQMIKEDDIERINTAMEDNSMCMDMMSKDSSQMKSEFSTLKNMIELFVTNFEEQMEVEKKLERASNKSVISELVEKLTETRTEIRDAIKNIKIDIVDSKFNTISEFQADIADIRLILDELLRRLG